MWEYFDFNSPYEGDITEINGIILPQSYLDFMREHNGGEGDTAPEDEDGSWLVLYPVEELDEVNDDYICENLPGGVIIGSNGSEELFGIWPDGRIFNVPALIEKEYLTVICDDIAVLPEAIKEFWKNMA